MCQPPLRKACGGAAWMQPPVRDDGTSRFDDEAILSRCCQLQRVFVTQDEDLLAIAHTWQQQGREFPGIIFMPQLAAGIGRFIEDLELVAKCCDETEVLGLVTRLPLK